MATNKKNKFEKRYAKGIKLDVRNGYLAEEPKKCLWKEDNGYK